MDNLSDDQKHGLRLIANWLRSSDPVFNLNGYAGTGKTHLAQAVGDVTNRFVQYGAYTGKATVRLRQKGCLNSATLHSLLYNPKGDSEKLVEATRRLLASKDPEEQRKLRVQIQDLKQRAKSTWTLKTESALPPNSILVIDEASMLSEQMLEDALKFVNKVLLLGDPAQLPPVRGRSVLDHIPCDYLLTEVHRQAADNPIIRAATMARNGEVPEFTDYVEGVGSFRYAHTLHTSWTDYAAANQILVGRNRTRQGFNRRYRERTGRTSWIPEVDERLIILRNTYGLEKPLYNGTIIRVARCDEYEGELYVDGVDEVTGDVLRGLAIWEGCFKGEDEKGCPKDAIPADYANALTVHKAQGSEWDNVLVYFEDVSNYRDQWLYTAITRAAKDCLLVGV